MELARELLLDIIRQLFSLYRDDSLGYMIKRNPKKVLKQNMKSGSSRN